MCSWCAQLVPPLMQLVEFSHAWNPYLTCVLLGALLVPPFMHLLQSSHASNLYSTRVLLARTTCTPVDAPFAFFARLKPRPVCSWRALLVPPLMQLVHSSHASSLYSARMLLARTSRTAVDAAYALSERLEPSLDLGSLAGTNFPADATACALSKRLGCLLDPDSLANTNCLIDTTACAVFERLGPLLAPRVCWLARSSLPMI